MYGATFYAFQIDGVTRNIPDCNSINLYGEALKDGRFYKVVADVRYLNGGIAGYVNYPEIKDVISCEETSPYKIGLPSIEDTIYGVTLIGKYADGDILFNEWGNTAVWKNGKWIWRYDKDIELDDGTCASICNGVTEADVQAGIEKGILSCKDYFVFPAKKRA